MKAYKNNETLAMEWKTSGLEKKRKIESIILKSNDMLLNMAVGRSVLALRDKLVDDLKNEMSLRLIKTLEMWNPSYKTKLTSLWAWQMKGAITRFSYTHGQKYIKNQAKIIEQRQFSLDKRIEEETDNLIDSIKTDPVEYEYDFDFILDKCFNLREIEKKVLRYKIRDQMTYKTIGEIFGFTHENARKIYERGMRRLRKFYVEKQVEQE